MRARTIREGSVGLLILAGIGLFGFLVLWLRGINPRQRSYVLDVTFDNTAGMQIGTPVRYRGVPVGRILTIEPGANSVKIRIEISQGDLRIPSEVNIATTQSGLIGETSIDITPLAQLSDSELALNPVDRQCDSTVILCNGDQLNGTVGVSYDDLLLSAKEISDFLTDPVLAKQISEILANTSMVTNNVVGLSEELNLLVQETRKELGPLALSARQATDAASRAALQVETSTAQTSANLDVTLAEVNSLLTANRGNISSTLENIQVSSDRLRVVMDTLTPVIQEGEFVGNLEALSANAASASEDLKDMTAALNTTENLVLLQQTLESARDVFQSAQKIMADVDELTGDPAIRDNIRNLINGLGGLVSSTQRLDNQTQLAYMLEAVGGAEADINPLELTPVAAPSTSVETLRTTPSSPTPLRLPLVLTPSTNPYKTSGAEPVLIYDGQRYIVQLADRESSTVMAAEDE